MNRRVVYGFVAAGLVIAALVFIAEVDRLIDAVEGVNLGMFGIGFLSTSLSYVFRGYVWVRFLHIAGIAIPRFHVWALFLIALFIRYLTPYGQVTTEPIVAYLITREGKLAYENGLAGIVAADYFNYVPYYTIGALGFLVVTLSRGIHPGIAEYLTGIMVLFSGLVLATVLVLYRRPLIDRVIVSSTRALHGTLGRLSTRLNALAHPTNVEDRLEGFYQTIDLIRANPRGIITATLAAHIGMVFLMLPVYTTARAVGIPISFAVVAFVVMVSKLGALFPGPGGLGGIEATIVAALVIVVGIPLATALAITLLYRLCTYWYTVAVGGTIAAVYSARTPTAG